jgi:uncharacterized glyoxalase superfamily protein PhnB
MAARSGRLYIIRFPENITLESRFVDAQPGSLGMCLYTYKVREVEIYWQRVRESAAQQLTEIMINEFAEKSFSFVAPDGYFWNIVESK